jgi:hypothetical protein
MPRTGHYFHRHSQSSVDRRQSQLGFVSVDVTVHTIARQISEATHNSVDPKTKTGREKTVSSSLKPSASSTNGEISASEHSEVMQIGDIVNIPPFHASLVEYEYVIE